MVKPHKVDLLSEIKGEFADVRLALIADYRGLSVEKMTVLRRKLRGESAHMRVIKNSFLKKISAGLGWEDMGLMLHGPSVVVYANTEALSAVKVLCDFAKTNEQLKIKGGVLEGKVLSEQEASRLAELPTKPQLISQLLSVMQAPMRNLVTVLSAPARELVTTVQAISDQKAKS